MQITNKLESNFQNIAWTDNYPIQYKYRQNFFKVASFANNHDNKSIIVHRFIQKIILKESWDATGIFQIVHTQ